MSSFTLPSMVQGLEPLPAGFCRQTKASPILDLDIDQHISCGPIQVPHSLKVTLDKDVQVHVEVQVHVQVQAAGQVKQSEPASFATETSQATFGLTAFSAEPLRRVRHSLKPETLTWAQVSGSENVEVFMWLRASARTFCDDSSAIPPDEGLSRNQPSRSVWRPG